MLPALAVLATLMLVARPLRCRLRAAGPRRALDPAGAGLPVLDPRDRRGAGGAGGRAGGPGVPDGDVFASGGRLAIVLTLLLQALPARWLADRLGLLEPGTRPVAVKQEAA